MSSDAMAAPAPTPAPVYPVRFDAEFQEKHSRLLIFVRWIFAIPHLLIIYALNAVLSIITFIAFFAILFTKKYPKGLFDFAVNIHRWQANVGAYLFLVRDEYPPFSWNPGEYRVTFEVDYPQEFKRFAPLYKWLLAIPNIIVLYLVLIVAIILYIVGWFAILFTGNLPRGIHDFLVGTARWSFRTSAYYAYLFTDEYPPFSMK
jgi:hypothetical protein